MILDPHAALENMSLLITQLEGPYKLYVMVGVAIVLTALITRFIFKTFKWFLLLALVATLIIGGFSFLIYVSFAP